MGWLTNLFKKQTSFFSAVLEPTTPTAPSNSNSVYQNQAATAPNNSPLNTQASSGLSIDKILLITFIPIIVIVLINQLRKS